MKRRVLIFSFIFILLLSFVLCVSCSAKDDSSPDDESGGTPESEPVDAVSPDAVLGYFTTADLDGNIITEAVFGDCELTMIYIWGTFSSLCIKQLPYLGEISGEYSGKGFQIIGIVCDVENIVTGDIDPVMITSAREIAAAAGADFLHIVPSAELNSARLSNVIYVPEVFFVDKYGKIVGEDKITANTKEEWVTVIEEMLTKVSN